MVEAAITIIITPSFIHTSGIQFKNGWNKWYPDELILVKVFFNIIPITVVTVYVQTPGFMKIQREASSSLWMKCA
jgi:hypothetical protein